MTIIYYNILFYKIIKKKYIVMPNVLSVYLRIKRYLNLISEK